MAEHTHASHAHHEHHEHAKHAEPKSEMPVWAIPAALLIVGLLVGYFAAGFLAPKPLAQNVSTGLSASQAADKAILLMNQNLLGPQGVSAKLVSVSESAGLYAVTFEIIKSGQTLQTIDAYLSTDGTFLFSQALNLSEVIPAQQPAQPQVLPKADTPTAKLFVMSFCPYGQVAIQAMAPAASLLGSDAVIEPHYVIYADYCAGGRCDPAQYCIANGSLCSMHGINEINEDVRQLCVLKYDKAKYWNYTLYTINNCQLSNIETCWKDAAKAAGVDEAKISACQASEGEALLTAEFNLNQMYGVQGSPTLLINEAEYSGDRSAQGYLSGICSADSTPSANCNATLSSTSATAAGSC